MPISVNLKKCKIEKDSNHFNNQHAPDCTSDVGLGRNMIRPQITKSQISGNRGELIAEAELSLFAVCNRMEKDFGFDYVCHLINDGHVSNVAFFVQVKSISVSKRKNVTIKVKKSTIHHWATSTIPVYLIICFLGSENKIMWSNGIKLATLELMAIDKRCREDGKKKVSLKIDDLQELSEETTPKFIKDIKEQSIFLDVSIDSMLKLRSLPDEYIKNEDIPLEFSTLSSGHFRYLSLPKEMRAVLLETYFLTWEKFDNRLSYGYPVGLLNIALYTLHRRALKTALVALYYMESDVIHLVTDNIDWVQKNMPSDDRKAAFEDSILHFHYSPFIRNPMFNDIVAGKIAVISVWLFDPEEVVPTIVSVWEENMEIMEKERLKNWKEGHYQRPDMIQALHSAVIDLTIFIECDSIIPQMAREYLSKEN